MKALLALAAVVLVPGALAGSAAAPGITPGSILIGGIAPLTGEESAASAVAKGAAAYFRYVNSRGGVHGRTIEYRVLDDRGDPVRTVEAARRLVQQDRVFALFGTVGTDANLAIRGYLNGAGVPQLFVASGAASWGKDARRYPWTIGYAPSYRLEAAVLARQVLKTRPNARIAVLYEDDADGRDLLAGFRRGLGATAGLATASTEVEELRATRADTLVVLASGGVAAQALAEAKRPGWRPQVYVTAAVSPEVATPGAVSVVFVKDPRDPRWAGDPGLAKYGRLRDANYVAGLASAFTLVDVLRRAGKNPTRAGVMRAARSLTEANNPFVLPGIVVKTSATDGFPIEQVALQRWAGGHWNVFTGPLTMAR